MKSESFIAAVSILTTLCLNETSFQRVVGGSGLDNGVSVIQTSDSGFLAIGVTNSFGSGMDDFYLVKTDYSGKVLWQKTIGGEKNDNGRSVVESKEGFVLVGFTESFGSGENDCYMVFVDSKGEILRSLTFGGEQNERCWNVVKMPDGGYALVGETSNGGAGLEDCYLVRTNSFGDELWNRTFGGTEGDRCFAIDTTEDGGLILAGQTYSEGAGDRDAFVIKTDADGALQWSRTWGGDQSDVAHDVTSTKEGDYLVTGYSTSLALDEDDPLLIRLDQNGSVRWTEVIELQGVNHTLTGEQTEDGGFILGGFTEADSNRPSSALAVKISAQGKLLWSKDILPTFTGQSLGYTARSTSDGGSIMTGFTTLNANGNRDMILVKLDENGN